MSKSNKTKTAPIEIVVLDRGFVYVGETSLDGQFLTIRNARNIRRWGTTKGLGELCDGPTSSTVLDKCGDVTAPLTSVVHTMATTPGKW